MSLLATRIVAKPWGRVALPPPFANPGEEPIGEIWFEPHKAMADLLVKYIFTGEKLSVQCHPSDAQTNAMGMGNQGKEECWLVVHAQPGAQLAIGFDHAIDATEMQRAALDGSIENLLTWHPVTAGDFFYIPANTVHAIGAGVTLIEVQQASDITYRLFDYGRPRELHIDEGINVASGAPYASDLTQRLAPTGACTLVEGPHFRLDRLDGAPDAQVAERYQGPLLVIPVDCDVVVGDAAVSAGQCALAASIAEVHSPASGRWLIAQPV